MNAPNAQMSGTRAAETSAPRLHTPRTVVTHYVAEFMLAAKNGAPADAFSTARSLFLEWAKNKRRMADYLLREERFGGDESVPMAWAMHLQHREYAPDNDFRRHWHVDVSLRCRGDHFDVRVTVSHALGYSFVGWTPAAPEPSAPKFIYDWLAHENLELRSGQFPIAKLAAPHHGRPGKLKERVGALKVDPAHADLLARLIFDPKRAMPVLVVHGEVNPVTFPLNPHRLQQLMLGTCYVVWAPPAAGWGPAWSANFPRGFGCRNNTVRLYLPGARKDQPHDTVRHRYFSEDDIRRHGGPGEFIAMIRDVLTRRLLAPQTGRIADCEDVLALRASEDFASQRSRLKSKDEELELYEAEHRRLLEKEKLSDQLLQEADAELSRTKSELDALRYHAKELTDNLEAAKNLASSTPAAFGHSDLLLCFLKNKAGVVDQLRAVAVIYPEAVHLLPSALRSAEDAAEFKHLDRLRDLLLKLVCDYRETLVAGKGNNEAGRIFGRNDFTAKEAESLSRTGRAARTFSYNGGDIFMEQHLKIGVKDSAAHCLRLHFHWDAKAGKIVIGHCGKHLPL